MNTLLDQIVQRLQNMPPFNIHAIDSAGNTVPWFDVTAGICAELVVHPSNVTDQASAVSAQIAHWGRLAALAARVTEITERRYRIWRDKKCLEFSTPPSDPDELKEWKKPTEAKIEQLYRTHPEYDTECSKVDRAKEAQASAEAILLAFRAKKDMMQSNPGRNVF